MKLKNIHLVIALAGIVATESSLKADVKNNREMSKNFIYEPNANALIENGTAQDNFFTEKTGATYVQEQAAKTAMAQNVKKQLKINSDEIKQIKKEHAQLKKNNVEKTK